MRKSIKAAQCRSRELDLDYFAQEPSLLVIDVGEQEQF